MSPQPKLYIFVEIPSVQGGADFAVWAARTIADIPLLNMFASRPEKIKDEKAYNFNALAAESR